jgi:hypothetical protein
VPTAAAAEWVSFAGAANARLPGWGYRIDRQIQLRLRVKSHLEEGPALADFVAKVGCSGSPVGKADHRHDAGGGRLELDLLGDI